MLDNCPTEPAAPILYVNADAGGANNGSSWADAFTDLQAALGAAVDGDALAGGAFGGQ